MDQNRGIGKSGHLPWHLPGDLKHFKEITANVEKPHQVNVVMMGRKTWDSLPAKFRPLPNRCNLVLTRNRNLSFPEGVLRAASSEEAIDVLEAAFPKSDMFDKVFVIGGGLIFEQAIQLPSCKTLHLTHIHQVFDCDTFFPEIPGDFKRVSRSPDITENGVTYHFADYHRE